MLSGRRLVTGSIVIVTIERACGFRGLLAGLDLERVWLAELAWRLMANI